MNAKVNEHKCRGCARGVVVCPGGAITMKNRVTIITEDECFGGVACIIEYPVKAITLME